MTHFLAQVCHGVVIKQNSK